MDWLDYLTIFVLIFAGWFGWLIYIAPLAPNEPQANRIDDAALDTIRDELDRQEQRPRKVRALS